MAENEDLDERTLKYVLKVTVVGPNDSMLYNVLSAIAEKSVDVDGIRIGSRDFRTDRSEIRTVVMSPTQNAMDVLLSLTLIGASGAIIVLESPDPELETKYRNEIREKVGSVPTRVFYSGAALSEAKREEVCQLFQDLVHEMMMSRLNK